MQPYPLFNKFLKAKISLYNIQSLPNQTFYSIHSIILHSSEISVIRIQQLPCRFRAVTHVNLKVIIFVFLWRLAVEFLPVVNIHVLPPPGHFLFPPNCLDEDDDDDSNSGESCTADANDEANFIVALQQLRDSRFIVSWSYFINVENSCNETCAHINIL